MATIKRDKNGRILFTKEMKKDYTILVPDMLPIHFNIMRHVFANAGYKIELLDTAHPEIKQQGLRYVHNDTCYPAILVIGQFIDALESGKYDPHKTALMIMQSGGGCRASNYIHLLRKALEKAGYNYVPVISFNLSGMESNSGFSLTIPIIRKCIAGVIYGDHLMLLSNQTRAYEVTAGDTDHLLAKWIEDISDQFRRSIGFTLKDMEKNFKSILSDEGREITIYRLFERDMCLFSASCMMRSIQFDVTIQAEKDTELWVIPPEVYQTIMEESTSVSNYTNELMASRFSDVMWLMEQIMWKSLDKRVATFLLEESSIEETNQLKITHEVIANHLGSHREVITRMLRYFQNEGMVRLSRGTIEITDPEKLEELRGN